MSRHHSKRPRSAIDHAVALALLACAAGVAVGHAANFTCTLTASGSWTTATNWTGCDGGVPNNAGGNTFDAILASGTATLQSGVTFGNATVNGGDWQLFGSTATATLTGGAGISGVGVIDLRDGAKLNIANGLNMLGGGARLWFDIGGGGGSQMTVGGNLVNSGGEVDIGNSGMTGADQLNVTGNFVNTSGSTFINGGVTPSATATLVVQGAAPSTLTGTYQIFGNTGGAALEWGSGGITQIGDGASNGSYLLLDGANAYAEIGATHSNSALTGLATIASNGTLELRDGSTVTTNGALTVNGGGNVYVDALNGSGGSQMTVGGDLSNGGQVLVGNGGMSHADLLSVQGVLTNTGLVTVAGGGTTGASANLQVAGAVPSTLTGQYHLFGGTGGAALEWGSGGITQIGDGASNGSYLLLDGANAYAEIGATHSNSALTGLATIASNGTLELRDGSTVTTNGALTVNGGGNVYVDALNGSGGSQMTVGGDLSNGGQVLVGGGGMSHSDVLAVQGSFTNSSTGTVNIQGNSGPGAVAAITVGGSMSNAGNVVIGSSGSLDVAGAGGYSQTSGVTTVRGTLTASNVVNGGGSSGGTLQGTGSIIGDVTNSAYLSGGVNGQPGTLSITGNAINSAQGTVVSYESANPDANSLIAVHGALALQGGTLLANAVNGLTFSPGQSFTVMTFTPGSMRGLFADVQSGSGAAGAHPTYLNLGNGTTLAVNYNVNSGNVTLTTVATPTTTAENWNGGVGTWSTGADWSSQAAPMSYSDVNIGSTSSGTVTLNQDSTVNSVTVQSGNALQYQSGAPAALTVGENVAIDAGGSVALSSAGDLLTTGGAISNAGSLTIGSGSVADVVNLSGSTAAVDNSGTIALDGTLQGQGALHNGNGATITLANGSLQTTSFVNAGSTSGYGSVAPSVQNSGSITASGGTLSAQNGISGAGVVQSDASATLSLGANSSAGALVNDGTLALNGHTITVSGSYQNASSGVGNSFDSRANVTGGGQILAAGANAATAQTISVNGGATTSGDVTINFGNVRVGNSASATYTIGNANSGGPALMGAIQTAAGGGTLTDARLSGSGVSAQNWGPVQAGAHSSVYQVTFDANTAGALTGQSVHLVNNFDNTNAQNISITGAAYAQAVGQLNNTAAHPDSFDFGTIQVGQTVTSNALSVSNVASGPSGYVEDLNASFGAVGANGGTGGASIVGNGTIEGLLAGATNDSALSISVTGTQAGTIQSGIGVNFYTAGTVAGRSDGLGAALVGSATVPVAGTIQTNVNVVNAADPVVNNAPIDLGNVRQNAASPSAYVSLTNEATTAPQAALDASISGDSAVSASGNFSALDPGQTNDTALQVGLNTASAGHVSGLATVDLVSDASNIGGCAPHCTMNLPAQQVAVSGNVYRIADPTANTASVTLAARVGGSAPSAAISVTNVSPDAYTEGLAATLGATPQGWTHSGSITNLVAGGTDASSLQVGLSTATAGVFNGSESVNFTSNGLIDHAQALGVGSATVALQGDVYTTAVEHLGTAAVNFGVVHVGQAVADQTVAVSNTAAQSALNDTLIGQLSMQPGSAGVFSTGGTLGAGVGAGQTNSSSLTVGLNTGVAGVYSGDAQFTGKSHDAQLTDLQLATLGIAVSGQVNNYANAIFQLATGGGTLSRSGSMYTLDFGNLTQGSAVSSLLSVLNDVSGPADNFGGTFAYGSLSGISLSGANWNAQSCTQSGYAFCLGAQGMLGGLGIDVNTGTLGTFTDTIALNGMGFYQGASYSPYHQNLTLTVDGNIISGGGTSLPEPGTLPLFAAGAALLLGLARRRRAAARREGVRRC